MGVAGSGKSTIAAALAADWQLPYIEADSLHSEANVAKMATGVPLTDADRWSWLAAVRQAMRAEPEAVIACSALKRSYRDALRSAGDVRFLDLVVDRDEVVAAGLRGAQRPLHARPAMVDSQFEALEPPGPEETDIAPVDASGRGAAPRSLDRAAKRQLRRRSAPGHGHYAATQHRWPRAGDLGRRAARDRRRARDRRSTRRETGVARSARPHPVALARRRDHRPAVRTAVRRRVRGRGAPRARHARGADTARSEAALRRSRALRADPEASVARSIGAGRRDQRRRDLRPLGGTDGGADPGGGERAAARRLGISWCRSVRSFPTR